MIIAVDAMGGDFAPKVVVEGALVAATELQDDASIVLVGDKDEIGQVVKDLPSNVSISHAEDIIGMNEHPAKAFAQKPNSSIGVGFRLLKEGKVNAFCGVGNTGAMMVGSLFSLKTYAGIQRPPIAGFLPLKNGEYSLMLDIGDNAECKPELLEQFAILGSLYAEFSLGKINFVGNIESRDMFDGSADVIVTEGFTGNVIFKMGEALYEYAHSQGIDDHLINKMNYEVVGGSPIIGVRGNVIVGHGISTSKAIRNMILLAERQVKSKVNEKLEAHFN